jgi:hypothetical protein
MSEPKTTHEPSPVEAEAARVFEEMHDCIRAPFWRRQPARRVTITQAPPNGIGPAFTARCACGASTNITDYSTW